MKNYFEYKIKANTEEQEVFIALLSQLFFEGFEQNANYLMAYIEFKDEEVNKLDIEKCLHAMSYEKQKVDNINWNQEWESSIEPIFFNQDLCIKTAFHKIQKSTKYEIIITPKMSFGTGHHETTSAIIELMKNIDFYKKNVLDIGSGTGILAIYAEMLGASNVLAIDNDENCVENMNENIEVNNCKTIIIKLADAVPQGCFDVVLCNIHLNFIVENIAKLLSILNKNGNLILSGFYNTDKIFLLSCMSLFLDKDVVIKSILEKNKWMAVHIIKL